MPFFSYTGRDKKGDLVQGVLESQDSGALANQLFGLGITPIEIAPGKVSPTEGGVSINLFKEKIQTIDLMLFSRQMYTLLKAGIPIMNALNGLQASTKNKALVDVVGDVRASLDSGRELSAAMRLHPKVFSGFYVDQTIYSYEAQEGTQ